MSMAGSGDWSLIDMLTGDEAVYRSWYVGLCPGSQRVYGGELRWKIGCCAKILIVLSGDVNRVFVLCSSR